MKRLFYILTICLVASGAWSFDITVNNCDDGDSTTFCSDDADITLDGDTFCGGSACSSGDTIYLEGGARNDLELQDFDGSPGYITVTNDPSVGGARVLITDSIDVWGALRIENSQYLDIRGDGLTGHDWSDSSTSSDAYGIKVSAAASDPPSALVVSVEDCDYIKIGYVEVDFSAATGYDLDESGFNIGSASFTTGTVTLRDWEIHHNYIHDALYAAFYLGTNLPGGDGSPPYIANFLVHHNLMEDLGAYGMTLKGLGTENTQSEVYNNTIRPSNRATGYATGFVYTAANCTGVGTLVYNGQSTSVGTCTGSGTADSGIALGAAGLSFNFPHSQEVDIYNNYIERVKGPGIKTESVTSGYQNHNIFNNIIAGVGLEEISDSDHYCSGIVINAFASSYPPPTIYNNTIIDAYDYSIYAHGNIASTANCHYDNLLVSPGTDYFGGDTDCQEGTSNYADTEVATGAGVGFTTWSDDSNYSNDDFALASGHNVDQCGDTTLSDDFDGASRPQGTDSEDGAYEYNDDGPNFPLDGVILDGGKIN